jgi:uncharacterized protein
LSRAERSAHLGIVGGVSPSEFEEVARLLGRAPLAEFSVAVRNPEGVPVVIENAPFLSDGRPMPTRFWLVDRDLRAAVSRLEAEGGVRFAEGVVDAEELESAHARYAADRDEQVRVLTQRTPVRGAPSGATPSGGVGGTRRGVKCLHAHLAWYLAGGDDPVGRWVARKLELDERRYTVAAHTRQSIGR